MADLQSQPAISDNTVVNSISETPVVVNQQLLNALNYLRAELEKLKKENKELSAERTTLFEQLENERKKNIINEISNDKTSVGDNHSSDNSEDSAFSEGDDDKAESSLLSE